MNEDRVDVLALLGQRLAERGLRLDQYPLKRYSERSFDPHEAFSAPRVLLVGEAAGIDGFTGEGIPQAVEYGALAGSYLAEKLAADDLGFGDWTARVHAAPFGMDMRVRRWLVPRYFGPRRELIDRLFQVMPEYIACTLDQYAGHPVEPVRWWKATGLAALRMPLVALKLKDVLTPPAVKR